MTSRADDEKFMARAIEVSLRHQGQTLTNPSVGCVLVKDGQIIAEAVTAIGGRPHAERQALEIAGEAARGATAYVTLEPCSHWGKTPPCANALVEYGVARVVVAVDDPDERVSGRGYSILRDAGIVVETGLLRDEGKRALAGYLTRQMKKRPHVILKLAISADGMIGRRGEGQVAITGHEARHAVHELRARCDCILVGIGTAIADDPELTVRVAGLEERSPVRIVLDRHFELPMTSKLVKTAREVPVVIAALPPSALPGISPSRGEIGKGLAARSSFDSTSHSSTFNVGQGSAPSISPLEGEMPGRAEGGSSESKRQQLTDAGVQILEASTLENLLHILAESGMSELLVEGGAFAAKSFLEADLVDRIMLFESPVVIGEGGIETPLGRADITGDYALISETAYGPDRCFDYERPI
ncbi:bifunctional diaminohydroxyphosphoribosylaminopyrimidine deaminase/5-amino-6-(5-phosphoribosylamino)uracil reductase RibD [Agrobacterium tumefaciens]|uniref:bifunctional diaminohydroxyphosphoribosylaminopyrimidine deaminase/5-amino-6-(5-phosphoribosylamino)uracil reductase RibD n=1 Tax=Agrobacterium tumefaciens TaxID=358 RepID=UPI000DDB8BE6|nr:bifunctional diaminohydroxyphosphoribosylaminopyrimidine deaminase/5-amino-6-(5-phosphoribosylamino)uracil reductase RibD [Agrobacterium tumefaciens]MBP2569916.1 diaminohydroxyphosphoribosylaminopyrimidine deaminase/5-amino-6-(5-phosphoribosylamino)uracil reductase [Agrobacterium tumefaciens]UXS23718.1 bifunctional diaminohydroxyphosphoribosylaminopyrimidine deaminase/5-amino-6-(5-phosphoribosylamino)uracil reductase RibD [Agrobacterium tumefaciens]UXS51881.1 bifunctional diaminohydroxyphosph